MLKNANIKNVIAGAIFVGLGYLALWQTYVEVLLDLPAPYSATLNRPLPAAGLPLLRGSVTVDGRSLIKDNEIASNRIALGNDLTPLHPYPYIWKSRELASKQEFKQAIDLLEYAKKRNPRSYPVRRLLAEYYLLTNNVGESLQEMFSSALLNPEWGAQFMEAVRLLGNNEQLQPQVIEQIASQPDWTNRFFAQLDPEKADDPFVIELSKRVPPNAKYRKQLIVRLAKRGEYKDAFALWLKDLNMGNKKIAWPYDPSFDALAGTVPFNWAILNSADARAEMARSQTWSNEKALYIYYFGRKRSAIVRQVMMNQPGRYSLSIPYSVRTHDGRTVRLKWAVRCKPDNQELGETVLDHTAKESGTLRLDFAVPSENCLAQELTLMGEAEGRSGQMDVEFRSVSSVKPKQSKVDSATAVRAPKS